MAKLLQRFKSLDQAAKNAGKAAGETHVHTAKYGRSRLTYKILETAKKRPLLATMAICCTSTTLSDVVIQNYFEKKEKVNLRRLLFFNQFGMWISGAFQFMLYVKFFPKVFNKNNLKLWSRFPPLLVLSQCSVALFIYAPMIYFPTFYVSKEVFYSDFTNIKKSCKDGFEQYYPKNYQADLKRFWSLWIPVHMVTFTVMPIYLRPIWANAVASVWNLLLSYYNGAKRD